MKKVKAGMTHEEFYKSAQHMYDHLNIAWSARAAEPAIVFDLDDPRME